MKEIKIKLPDDLYRAFMEIKKKSIVNGRQMTRGELGMVAITLFIAAFQENKEVNQA